MSEEAHPPRRYVLWRAAVLAALAFSGARMALEVLWLLNDGRMLAAAHRPLIELGADVHADISKTMTCMTRQNIIFELYGLKSRVATYAGAPGALVRETDSGETRYALNEGRIVLGMDHGMIISRVTWYGRSYFFGAPPGWGITREELLSQ